MTGMGNYRFKTLALKAGCQTERLILVIVDNQNRSRLFVDVNLRLSVRHRMNHQSAPHLELPYPELPSSKPRQKRRFIANLDRNYALSN